MSRASFVELTGSNLSGLDLWPALVISKEEIDAEVDRLAALPRPAHGRRAALIVHPRATAPGLGLAPGIQVSLDVLRPGERSAALRSNSTQVNFCIRGGGQSIVAGQRFDFAQFDVWNTPSMATHWHANDGSDLQVRLTYSNAALLEQLHVHVVDEQPPEASAPIGEGNDPPLHRTASGMLELSGSGASLMPYEELINPRVVESRPWHWPWSEVKQHLDKLDALGRSYVGRRLYLLFNPASGRTNGTTHSFFATMTIRPPSIVDRPHRHVSAAINYFFAGSGRSVVEGQVYEWKAGDLMFSAPGWGVHNHASYDEPVYELTVQDSPLHIAMESLLWQEDLQLPFSVLGSQLGFQTNRPSKR